MSKVFCHAATRFSVRPMAPLEPGQGAQKRICGHVQYSPTSAAALRRAVAVCKWSSCLTISPGCDQEGMGVGSTGKFMFHDV